MPLLTEAKKRSSLIQLQISGGHGVGILALSKELGKLDNLVEETEGVLDTLGTFHQQMRQDDFSSGVSSGDEEEDEEEEEEGEEEEEIDEETGEVDQDDPRHYSEIPMCIWNQGHAWAAEETATAQGERKRKLRDREIQLHCENGYIKERRLR